MNLKMDFYKLNKLSNEVSDKLYNIFFEYLKYYIDFPYGEVNTLIDRYESLYLKVYSKKNSGFNKLLSKINFFGIDNDLRYSAPSKEMILLSVSEKIFNLILFDADKYIPVDEDSKNYIYNKLLPIVKNLRVTEIVDIYSKMKKSAIIRGFVFDDTSYSLLQEMFIEFIMSIVSYSSYNKFNYIKSTWTPEEICINILKEPIMYRNCLMKRVKEKN